MNRKLKCRSSAFIKLNQLDPWIEDQMKKKKKKSLAIYNFASTVMKFYVTWSSLPLSTKSCNCMDITVNSWAFPSWSLIQGWIWSGLLKAEPSDKYCSFNSLWLSGVNSIIYILVSTVVQIAMKCSWLDRWWMNLSTPLLIRRWVTVICNFVPTLNRQRFSTRKIW